MAESARIYISRWALRIIESEARHHVADSHVENETGGILIGRPLEDGNGLLIIGATDPGPDAERQTYYFSPDIEHNRRLLQEYRTAYPNADYVGTWHKHPPTITYASQGDLATARQILLDSDSYPLSVILAPIVHFEGGRFVIQYYLLTRAMATRGEAFLQLPVAAIEILGDLHPLLRDEVTAPADGLRLRIGEENRMLRLAGFGTRVKRSEADSAYLIEVTGPQLPQTTILLDLDQAYPQLPPQLVVEQAEGQATTLNALVFSAWWRKQASNNAETSLLGVVEHMVQRLFPTATAAPSTEPASATKRIASTPPLQHGAHSDATALSPLFAATTTSGKAVDTGVLPPPRRKQAQGWRWRLLLFTLISATLLLVAIGARFWLTRPLGVQGTSLPTAIIQLPLLSPTASLASWQAVQSATEAGDLSRQVELLQALLKAGATEDPQGASTASRLFATSLLLGDQLRADARYPQARQVFSTARGVAENQALLSRVEQELTLTNLLDQAATADRRNEYALAERTYSQILTIQPTPAPLYLELARTRASSAQRQRAALDATNAAMAAYHAAIVATPPDYPAAIKGLDEAIAIVDAPIDLQRFPVAPFHEQLPQAAALRATAQLSYAAELQLGGYLPAARTLYEQVRDSQAAASLAPELNERARDGIKLLDEAERLWKSVNADLSNGRRVALERARDALEQLVKKGFAQALNPANSAQSAEALLRNVKALLQPTPTLRSTGTPALAPQLPVATTAASTTEATPAVETTPLATTATSTTEATPAVEATPPASASSYTVFVREMSPEERTLYFGEVPPEQFNAFVNGPGGLTIAVQEGPATRFTFSSDARKIFLNENIPIRLIVISGPDGGPADTRAPSEIIITSDKYYLITIERVS